MLSAMRHFVLRIVPSIMAVFLVAAPAVATEPGLPANHEVHNKPPIDAEGTLTWDALANLEIRVETPAPLRTLFYVEFPESLRALDGERVRIKGFMYPLEAGETHDKFLLAALPPACPFCLPGNARTLVDVRCDRPVGYTMEPVILEGQFTLLEEDDTGLYYRLTGAGPVE